jgi:hypothetical protein
MVEYGLTVIVSPVVSNLSGVGTLLIVRAWQAILRRECQQPRPLKLPPSSDTRRDVVMCLRCITWNLQGVKAFKSLMDFD